MLPMLRASGQLTGRSAVVITGSKQGITNPPGNLGYNMSKAAVKILAEQLSYELRDDSISTHLLIPGWTWTAMTENWLGRGLGQGKHPTQWMPDQVADLLEKKIGEGQFWVLCPDDEVTLETDYRRILWNAGDIVHERPPLRRWRPEYSDQVDTWMVQHKGS